jgi:PAS domain S-box-containing protein
MTDSVVLRLIANAALLLWAVQMLDLLAERLRFDLGSLRQPFVGALLGLIGVGVIEAAVVLAPGVIFDVRSVLLALVGLFFGVIPTLVAMALVAAYRLHVGGGGALVGVAVTLTAGLVGLLWRRLTPSPLDRIPWLELLGLGAVVHLLVLALLMGLPAAVLDEMLRHIAPFVLTAYPLLTVVVGLLFSSRLARQRDIRSLAENEESFRLLTERVPAIIYRASLDKPHRATYVSPRIQELGYSPQAWLAKPGTFLDYLHPQDRPQVEAKLDAFPGRSGALLLEYRMRTADGRWRYFQDAVDTLLDDQGNPCFLQGVMLDVTERRQGELELRKLALVVEQSPESIIITDREARIEYVNDAFCRVTGYHRDEVLGQNPRLLQGKPLPREEYVRMWREISAGRVWRGEFRNRRKDGALYWEAAIIAPVIHEGRITHYVAIKEEITARRELEERLRNAKKMEEMGQLAGGLAHDFGNFLTPVLGYAEMLYQDLAGDEVQRRRLEHILRAATRAQGLTRQLLAFGSRQAMAPGLLELGQQLRGSEGLLSGVLRPDTSLRLVLPAEPLWVLADYGQIEQALLNLVINARDALPEGGEVTVEAVREAYDPERAATLPGLVAGEYASIRVCDRGVGIAPEMLPRLFEPLFTTKPTGQGTGLGLSMAFGIARQHQGHLHVQSSPGQGTQVSLLLPLQPPPGEALV